MIKNKPPELSSEFAADVYNGLTSEPKQLSSKFFYDKKGDELFQQIMELPEYYLTGKEFSILEENKEEIGQTFNHPEGFDLIELGAGDGKKTKLLLRHFTEQQYNFKYLPVDISNNVLDQLQSSLKSEIPDLEVTPQQGTYAQVLDKLADYKARKKVILFLGSNIGNLSREQAVSFLKKIAAAMSEHDLFFLGMDQKKHPQKILDAYNDASGVTAAFNKNLLSRINREFDADFNPDNFLHWPVYDPVTGIAKSYLVSTLAQKVRINSLNLEIDLRAWESIHTEVSQKYDDKSVAGLAEEAGLQITGSFSDPEQYFKNYIFKGETK